MVYRDAMTNEVPEQIARQSQNDWCALNVRFCPREEFLRIWGHG